MAAQAVLRLIRKTLGLLRRAALAAAAIVAVYVVMAWIGSSIPRNPGWREPAEGVTIMVESNGIHTALVLPIVTPQKDWRTEFPLGNIADPAAPFTHVAISWGEREVFLNTPTWWDLRPSTVLRILGMGGEGLLHVSWYARPAPDDDLRPLRLTQAQYDALVRSIETRLPPDRPLLRHPGYGRHDTFYDSRESYTAVRTCNQWTSDRLADAGVRIGWWTPFAGGVMKWVADSDGLHAQTAHR